MQRILQLRTDPQTAAIPDRLQRLIAHEINTEEKRIQHFRILKKSIDARQRRIQVNLSVVAYIDEPAPAEEYAVISYPDVSRCPSAIVVGAGPAGLFASLRLMEHHIRPILLERGKDVHERRKDIALISREHRVQDNSNYAFGEGGAGAYSDGKLYTRSTKRGDVNKILRLLCQHGASTSILSDAHPHIGTDRLPKVIEAIRHTIVSHGGEVHFQTCVNGLLLDHKGKATGVVTTDGETYEGPVILATGHSARDVYRFLLRQHISLEEKGIAVGVRLEHPSALIDSIMYHNPKGRGPWLPAAEYRMSAQSEGRGVYSFCMCPGGFVIPAASGAMQVVVNGMSPSGRNSRWSNSGMVVELRPEDLQDASLRHLIQKVSQESDFADIASRWEEEPLLGMLHLQEALEYTCWCHAHRSQQAPIQRMTDFVDRHMSNGQLPSSSYSPGVIASPLHEWMPSFLTRRLQEGFRQFGARHHGFLTREALLLAVETRTSSPLRIPRLHDKMCHVSVSGLYPCGEGAGYAGGIVSAAIDGELCADALAANR